MTRFCAAIWSVLLTVAVGSAARAQCPDAAPPPCKGATPSTIRRSPRVARGNRAGEVTTAPFTVHRPTAPPPSASIVRDRPGRRA
jgi:hypothetical protein